jgi:HK97 family phage major capsid protein
LSEQFIREGVVGSDNPSVTLATQIGTMAHRLEEIASDMGKAKDEDGARYQALREEQARVAADLTTLKAKHDAEVRESEVKAAIDSAAEAKAMVASIREPSKARIIGSGIGRASAYERGSFLNGVLDAGSSDTERQAQGKALLSALSDRFGPQTERGLKAATRQENWGKVTLGLTDATGGWIIPNAIVDEFIVPAATSNIYRNLCTVVPGVTAATIDIPFRIAARTAAVVVAWGDTKENVNLVYNGYTATMYTLARIYDISNQFLRHSQGAAEQDVLSELAAAFAAGESDYIREGTGTSEPFGYTSALTNGPAAFRSTFTASTTTLAGSVAKAIATAAGDLAGRGVTTGGQGLSAVLSASSYWDMLSQGTDTAGFFFNPASGPEAINAPAGTLISPFGIPVYPDARANQLGTAAVTDNLVVGNWKKFKLYFGETYRVDTSDQGSTRWDLNLTGFRGEEEMGFDARPAVYAGYFQMITDITG